jgi:glycosyltransferase involved in cell wall biosynthesis
MPFKLAIVVTHPIRYFVPLIQLLSKRNLINIKVFYTYGPDLLKTKKYDPENRKKEEPDLPLFEGYDYSFVYNAAKSKSTYKYNGINNPGLIKEIEQWNADAVLVLGWKFKSHLKVLRYFKGKIPVHFRGDSTLLQEAAYSNFRKIGRRILLQWVYTHVDNAWYVGTHNKAYFKEMGLKEKQLTLVPHVVDNNRFKRTPQLKQKALLLKKQMNVDDGMIILYAGKIVKQKGVFTLFNAFIQAGIHHAHLVFVGTGAEVVNLKKMAADKSNIHFLSHQRQSTMPVIYSMADILIQPSESDTWGLVINEAMANGLAVVASDNCGGALDLIHEGDNGYIFRSKDESRLTQIIKELADNPDKVKRMGLASLNKISNFSYEVAADAIEKMFVVQD